MPKVHNPTHLYSDESPAALLSQLSITQIPLNDEFSFSLQVDNLFEVDDTNEKNIVSNIKETIETLITITDECQENEENSVRLTESMLISSESDKLKNKNPLVGLFKQCKVCI